MRDAEAVSLSSENFVLTTQTAATVGQHLKFRPIRPRSGTTLKDVIGNEATNQSALEELTNASQDDASLGSSVDEGTSFA